MGGGKGLLAPNMGVAILRRRIEGGVDLSTALLRIKQKQSA